MAASSPSGPAADALAAELSFLSLLLARNCPQHRRCIYFKRLSLALKAVRQLPSADEAAAAVKEWREHVRALLGEEGGESKMDRKRRREEERWTLDGEGGAEVGPSHHDDDDRLRRTLQQMIPILKQLRALVTNDIPAVVSRLLHAAAPVLHELGRGYFVPFLTACLACLGRMRELLMRTGRMVGEALRETVPRLRDLLRHKNGTMGKRERGAEKEWNALEDLVMPAFSAPATESGRPNGAAADDEWNVLMAQFVDAGHDELTKRVSEFARERRWERAAERWGLKGAASNPSDLTEPQSAELECSENRGRGNDGERSDDKLPSRPAEGESGNDTGELVGDGRDSAATDEGGGADANLARILQRANERRRGSAASASDSSTKKNRKRERGGASDKTGEPAAGATSEDERSAAPRQDLRANPRGKELDGDGSRDVAKEKRTKKKKSKKVKRQKRKASNVIDDIFGS